MKRRIMMLSMSMAALVLAGSLLLVSCDKPVAFAPDDSATSASIHNAQRSNPGASLRRVPRKISLAKGKGKNTGCGGTTESMWMTVANGGEMSHCGHELIVPEGALQQDTLMTITVMESDFIDVDFGPDGEFNKPVVIRLSYADANLKGINVDNLRIAWVDEQTGKLIEIPSVVHKDRRYVEGKTDHFTQYTLSTR